MKVSVFLSFLSLAIPALANSSASGATEAAGSFGIQIKDANKSKSCNAVLLATRKSERCFAVTARECLIDPKPEGGTTNVRSAELGENTAEYFITPGDAALLSWKCTGNEYNLPSFTLSDYWTDKKIGLKVSVKYGKAVSETTTMPSQLHPGEVVGGSAAQSFIKTPGHKLGQKDLGEPLLCRTDMGSGPVGKVDDGEALCGVFVSPQDSRFATGEAMAFIRTKLKALGVPEPKIVSVEGRRAIQED